MTTAISGFGVNFSQWDYSFQRASITQAQTAQRLLGFLDSFEMGGGAFQGGAFGLRPPMGFNQYAMNSMFGGLGDKLQAFGGMDMQAAMMMRSLAMFQTNVWGVSSTSLIKGQGPNPNEKDKFAVSSCRSSTENPTNLNNSPMLQLALNHIIKSGTTNFDEIQKKLKEEYGIEAESTTIKTNDGTEWKALKFKNGGIFADGNGNGIGDAGDYNFKGALDDIKEKYGVSEEEFDDFFKKAHDAGATSDQLTAAMNRAGVNGDYVDIQSMYGMSSRYGQFDSMGFGSRGFGGIGQLGGFNDPSSYALQSFLGSMLGVGQQSQMWPMSSVQQIFMQAQFYAQLQYQNGSFFA